MSSRLPLIWTENPGTKFCVLTAIRKVDDSQELTMGISRATGFPADAYFKMDKSVKKQVALSDALTNVSGIPVVSERLMAFLRSREVANTEFMPVKIIDHKDKEVTTPYYVMNPLSVVDCIDVAKSKLRWNNIDPELISSISKLVLDSAALDPTLLVFRPKHKEGRIFVRRDLADAILAGHFTGLDFVEPSDFIG
jgi:uncharacterized protein DUF1629